MKIIRIQNHNNNYETWLTPNRKVLSKSGNIELASQMVLGQEVYDVIDGAYLGIVVEIEDCCNCMDCSIAGENTH
jgi:hypothetical protein